MTDENQKEYEAMTLHYQQAQDFNKEGRLEEAAESYRKAMEIAEASNSPDRDYRIKMFAGMLGPVYYKLGKYDLAKPLMEMSGHPMPKPPSNLKSTGRAIKALKKYDLLSELTPKLKKRIFEEDGGDPEDSDIIPFLTCYYQYGVDDEEAKHADGRVTPLNPRALKDGFLIYDHRFSNDSDNIAADLNDIIGGEPMYHELEVDFWKKPFKYILGTAGGEKIDLPVEDIDDIIAFYNKALEARGDLRRIVSLETGSDFSAWMIMSTIMFKDLCKAKASVFEVESVPGVDVDKWLKMKAKV